jgi:hypothetical protein
MMLEKFKAYTYGAGLVVTCMMVLAGMVLRPVKAFAAAATSCNTDLSCHSTSDGQQNNGWCGIYDEICQCVDDEGYPYGSGSSVCS